MEREKLLQIKYNIGTTTTKGTNQPGKNETGNQEVVSDHWSQEKPQSETKAVSREETIREPSWIVHTGKSQAQQPIADDLVVTAGDV